jgi:hypothetical protein
MSENNKMSTYEKRIAHNKATEEISLSSCENGISPDYDVPPYPY